MSDETEKKYTEKDYIKRLRAEIKGRPEWDKVCVNFEKTATDVEPFDPKLAELMRANASAIKAFFDHVERKCAIIKARVEAQSNIVITDTEFEQNMEAEHCINELYSKFKWQELIK